MPTYDWACLSGHTFTARGGFDEKSMPCECGGEAFRVQVYRVNSIGFAKTPPHERDLSVGYKAFSEATAELDYRHERLKDATQIADLPPPPLFSRAKAKAQALHKKGVTVNDL